VLKTTAQRIDDCGECALEAKDHGKSEDEKAIQKGFLSQQAQKAEIRMTPG